MGHRILRWLRAWSLVVPALLRVAVRRARAATRSADHVPSTVVIGTFPSVGVVSTSWGREQAVTVDDREVGRLTCSLDLGTGTAETSSRLPADEALTAAVVELVATSAAAVPEVRRVAWFVPADDAVLRSALAGAAFVQEGAAVPPLGDPRPHQLWARVEVDA